MQKLKVFWMCALLLCGAIRTYAQPTAAYLVQNGQPRSTIVLPPNSGPATQRAAQELQEYIEKISGAKLPVTDKRPATGNAILLETVPDDPRDLFVHDSFTLDAQNGTLAIRGHSDDAVLYGAYEFLSTLGVRWFMPSEIGENVPRRRDIQLANGTTKHRPSFRTRTVGLSGVNRMHFDAENMEQQHLDYDRWLVRNRQHFARTIHNIPRSERHKDSYFHRDDFNWVREDSRHNIGVAVRNADFEKEPERFALVTRDGETKRRPIGERAQICFTHPRNIETAQQVALEYFEQNPHQITFPLSLADHYGICECEVCTRANNGISPAKDPNRLVWTFMNAVASGLTAKMPSKRICFYATYQIMTRPPHDIKAAPGIVARTCHISSQARVITDPSDPRNREYMENIRLVKASGAEMASYDYSMFAGNPQPLTILYNVKTYHDLGYVWYGVECMGRDEQRYIVEWVLSQLSWDATQDPRQLLETFCREYYGPAGNTMIALLDHLEAQVQRIPAITLGGPGTSSLMLTPEVVAKGRQLLKQAAAQTSGREAERVRRFNNTFEMMSRAAAVARIYYEALDERSEAGKQRVADELKAFEAFWNEHKLAQIASPRVLESVREFAARAEKIQPRVAATASPDLVRADRTTLMNALFSNAGEDRTTRLLEMAAYATVPEKVSQLTLLPEVWQFKIDPRDEGEKNKWMAPDFDDSQWTPLSTYNTFERQGYDHYDGVFWYRLKFTAPEISRRSPTYPTPRKVWLRIGALDESGDVYVNGQKVLEREHGDYRTSFAAEVTSQLKPGRENVIAVRGKDIYGAGGIWKPIGLYTTP